MNKTYRRRAKLIYAVGGVNQRSNIPGPTITKALDDLVKNDFIPESITVLPPQGDRVDVIVVGLELV